MKRTYKFRLHPTGKQVRALERTLNLCRILYNCALLDRREHHRKTGQGLTYNRQAAQLVRDKEAHLILVEVHSQVLQDVLRRVDRAFDNFFRRLSTGARKPGYPRFKGEGRYDSITYPQQPGFRITAEGRLYLSKIGHIKIKLHRPIQGEIKTCTVRRQAGKWYACIAAEIGGAPPAIPIRSAVGVDRNIINLATLSDGRVIENPRQLRGMEKRLALFQRRASRKKPGSRNRKKANARVARQHAKVADKRRGHAHKVSRFLVDTYDLIVFEDLLIPNMVRNGHLAKHIHDAGWGMLARFASYKAEEAGKAVLRVEPRGTTSDCSGCGKSVPKQLGDRLHRCPACGLEVDRDVNAARNILTRGLRLLNTAGTAGIHAWGDPASTVGDASLRQAGSLNQEAPSVRAG